MEQYKCEVCGNFITDEEGITTLYGLWVCDNDNCRTLDKENQAIENIEIRYKIEADMHIAPLEVEYQANEYRVAVEHFKSWLNDDMVFNEMFYKVIYEDGKEKEKIYIKLK